MFRALSGDRRRRIVRDQARTSMLKGMGGRISALRAIVAWSTTDLEQH
jgi:hypothetical protein